MQAYYLDGEKYYYSNGKWLTSNYMVAPIGLASRLNKLLVEEKDFTDEDVDSLIHEAKIAKDSSNHQLARKILEIAIEKANKEEIKLILPMLTSTYRSLGFVDDAIKTANEYLDNWPEVASSALFTSMGAAYCDKEMYAKAKYYADRAYAMTGGKGANELSALYGRLKSLTESLRES